MPVDKKQVSTDVPVTGQRSVFEMISRSAPVQGHANPIEVKKCSVEFLNEVKPLRKVEPPDELEPLNEEPPDEVEPPESLNCSVDDLNASSSDECSTGDCSVNFDSDWEEDLVRRYLDSGRNNIQQISESSDDNIKIERSRMIEDGMSSKVEYREPILKDGRFHCPYHDCTKSFSSKYQTTLHINGIHRNLRLYVCSICGEAFPNPRRRQRHAEVHHPPENGYKCDKCSLPFPNRFALAEHTYTYHRETTDLKCEICGKDGFVRENQIEKHILMDHTKRNQDGSFPCIHKGCDYVSPRYPAFRVHLRTHKDPALQFVCKRPNCDERFLTSFARIDHERAVHGHWVCEICGRKSNMMRQHFLPHHLRLLDFRCSECQRVHKEKKKAESHMRNIHKRIAVDVCYRVPAVKSTGDLVKVFLAFENGSITDDMFLPEGKGLDLGREDVNAAIIAAVRDIKVRKQARTMREIDREKKMESRRFNDINIEQIEDILHPTPTQDLFVDSLDAIVAPLDIALSTNSELELSLHKRPEKRQKIAKVAISPIP